MTKTKNLFIYFTNRAVSCGRILFLFKNNFKNFIYDYVYTMVLHQFQYLISISVYSFLFLEHCKYLSGNLSDLTSPTSWFSRFSLVTQPTELTLAFNKWWQAYNASQCHTQLCLEQVFYFFRLIITLCFRIDFCQIWLS